MLQLRRVFERMGRNDSIIVIGGSDQNRRVNLRIRRDVVQRRDLTNPGEFFREIGIAVFSAPIVSDGEFVVTIQIENTDLNDDTREEIRPKIGTGSDGQSSVASTGDGDLLRSSVLMIDQPFCTRAKIEKGVAFLLFVTIFVPRFAVFRSATNVGHDEHAVKMIDPEQRGDGKERFHRNGESAVGIEMRGIVAVLLQILSMDDEYRHLDGMRRIQSFRFDEDLFGDEVIQIDTLEFNSFEQSQRSVDGLSEITRVDRRRRKKRFQTNEDLRFSLISPSGDVSDRKIELSNRSTVGHRVEIENGFDVREISNEKELLVDTCHIFENVARMFSDDLFRFFRLAVHADQTEVRRLSIGAEIEKIAFGGDEVIDGVHRVDYFRPLRSRDDRIRGVCQRKKPDFVLTQGSFGDTGEKILSVIGRFQREEMSIEFVGTTSETDVRRSRRVQSMEIDFLNICSIHFDRRRTDFFVALLIGGVGIGGVEDSSIVRCPTKRRELRPEKNIVEFLARGHVEEIDRRPIGARVGDTVTECSTIEGEIQRLNGDSSIFGELIRIEKNLRFIRGTLQRLQFVINILILQTRVHEVIILPIRLFRGTRELRNVEHLFQMLEELLSIGNGVEIGLTDLILFANEFRRFGGIRILQPPVTIVHFDRLGSILIGVDHCGIAMDRRIRNLRRRHLKDQQGEKEFIHKREKSLN